MNIRSRLLAALAVAAFCFIHWHLTFVSALAVASEDTTDVIGKLWSPTEEVRRSAVDDVLEARSKQIAELQIIVRESISDSEAAGTAKWAVILLGRLRAIEAVPLLVENLTFRPAPRGFGPGRPVATELANPSVGALMTIGAPSLDPVIEKVADSDDHQVMFCGAIVISRILGTDLAVAYVESHINSEPNEIKSARLQRLLAEINTRFRGVPSQGPSSIRQLWQDNRVGVPGTTQGIKGAGVFDFDRPPNIR